MPEETVTANGTSDVLATPTHSWYRVALVATIVLVLAVVALLPVAIRSMQEVLGRGSDPLYNVLETGVIAPEAAAAGDADMTYFNLGVVDLDEDTGQITLAVSGNRKCDGDCPTLDLTFAALDDDADERRGLPPSTTLTLTPDNLVFSEAVQLPVRGQPSLYPFDQYRLWLAVGGIATEPDGTVVELTPGSVSGQATVTMQNRVPDMIMEEPEIIDPATARAATDPFGFLTVRAVTFARPAYLQVLAIVLVLLVAISASLALFTRGIDELVLGFGGIILGVWGVRSILMPHAVASVTAVDLALSWLILLLLLGLAVRAGLHFHRHSHISKRSPHRTS